MSRSLFESEDEETQVTGSVRGKIDYALKTSLMKQIEMAKRSKNIGTSSNPTGSMFRPVGNSGIDSRGRSVDEALDILFTQKLQSILEGSEKPFTVDPGTKTGQTQVITGKDDSGIDIVTYMAAQGIFAKRKSESEGNSV